MNEVIKMEMPSKGKKQKRINIEQAANGFVVHCYDYEYGSNELGKVFRTVDEVVEFVKKKLK